MAGISLLSANLATVCMESLFYGIFFVLCLASLYILACRKQQTLTSPITPRVARCIMYLSPMSTAAIFLFMTNTAHWIIGVYRMFQAFVVYEGGTQPMAFYGDVAQPTEVVQTALLMASLIIGDAMIIYRLWIVWAYSYLVVVFPSGTLMGLTVCAVGVVYQLSRSRAGEDIFLTATEHWITANCVFTLCTNVYSTAMIAWRIWRVNRQARRFGGTSLMGVMGILIESAALYTAWTIFFFVTYSIRSNLQYTCSETYCAIAGIAFMLINVRVGMGWAQRAHGHPSDVLSGMVIQQQSHDEQEYGMRRVAVNITRVVHQDDGSGPPMKSTSSSSVDLSSPTGNV